MENTINISETAPIRKVTKEVFNRVHNSFKQIINNRQFMAVYDEETREIVFEPCNVIA